MSNNINIFPDICEYAISQNLKYDPKSLRLNEVKFQCIWCGDSTSKGKYKLSLNKNKGIYKCWICKNEGGTIDFIMAVEKKSKAEVIDELREKAGLKKGKAKQRHPAENLTTAQLKLLGYNSLRVSSKMEPALRKRALDWIWNEWNEMLDFKRRCALQMLMLCVKNGKYSNAITAIKKMSEEIGYDLLTDAFNAYGSGDSPPKWAEGTQEWVDALYSSFLLRKNTQPINTKNEEAIAL